MPQANNTNARAWTVTVLLAAFMMINFMDKAVLGIVAKRLMEELHIQPGEFGLIASSFFLLFSISAIVFGFIADRVSSWLVLLILAGIWGLSQFPLAFVASVPVLYFSRILLGVGEGPAYPLALHACYKWFNDDQRNVPSSVIFQGVTVGLLISGPILTFLLVNHGWHSAFLLLAVASLVWMVLWFFLGADGKIAADPTTKVLGAEKVPYWALLTDPSFLGNMALYWVTYWIFSVMFTWVPAYLSTVLNYSPTATGWMFMVFTGMNIPIVLGGSVLSQRLMKRGVSSVRARVWLSCGFVLLGGVSILASIYLAHDALTKVILLAIGCNLPQLTFVLSSTIVAEIVPSLQRSGILSINSALATTGGLIAPALTGRFIQNAVSPALGYDQGFVVSACLAIGMAIIGFLIINPETSRRRFAAASVVIGERAPSAVS